MQLLNNFGISFFGLMSKIGLPAFNKRLAIPGLKTDRQIVFFCFFIAISFHYVLGLGFSLELEDCDCIVFSLVGLSIFSRPTVESSLSLLLIVYDVA